MKQSRISIPSAMKCTSTLTENVKRILSSLLVIILVTLLNLNSYAQTRIFANEVSYSSPATISSLLGCGNLGLSPCYTNAVDNPANAISTSTSTFARVKSSAGLALGIAAFQGEIELKFAAVVPAGTTSYIRINSPNADLLNTLLGGNLGNVLTNVVGTVALGNRYFEAGARMGTGAANNVFNGNSANPFSTDNIKLIKDANGYFYVAITPAQAYDRVYIKDFTNAVLGLGATSYTDVYYAFHGGTIDPCAQGFATGFEGTGLTADLLGLGKAGVTNPERAIDADLTNFSQISLGALGVAGTISQIIYFETLSTPGDDFNVTIQAPQALINAGLLNNISVTAYNGATSVYTSSLSSLLDLDLLGLLNTGQPAAIPFSPGTQFDRVKVTISSLLNASLTQTFNLYGVTRSAGRPTFTAPASNNVSICSGTSATLRATTPSSNQLLWYESATGGTPVTTSYNGTFVTPVLTANKTYYVSAKNLSCAQESARVPVTVTLNPIPDLPVITTNSQTISAGQSTTLQATATGGNTIQWFASQAGGIPLATGPSFTTPSLNATAVYYVGTESALGCASASRVPVTVTVTNDPVNPNCNAATMQQSGIDGICVLCSIQGAGNSIDNDPANFTRINLAVGVGASGYQRLLFASPGSSTDSIRLDLETPTGLTDLTILNGITVRVMNGNVVVASYPLNSALLNLQLLGGNRFKATVPAGGVYDRVEIRLNALVSALSNLNIYGAEIIFPNPTVASSGLNVCAGNATTLSATPNGGTNLKWYDTATGGTALATGNSFTTPVLSASAIYYIEVSKGNCANQQRIPVTVNVNPPISFAGIALTNATLGATYSKQVPLATGGTPAFTYTLAPGSVLPAGLSIANDGTIAGTPTGTGDFNFSVLATDSKACVASANFTLKVTPALLLPAAVLPNGTTGTVYPVQTIPAATGGTTPYTYTASNLPPGLTFDPATRQISGTPTQIGNFIIPVTATDANGNTVVGNYTIVVRDPLTLPAATLANGTVGTTYSTQTIPSAAGGNGPYSYSASALPPGLTFNPSSREISGTPTQVGNFTIPVTATDADGKTVTTNYSITVGAPLVLAPKIMADGTVGSPYATETIPAATGGTAPYTYVATNLPPGLAFNATTRQISGTPTQSGTFNVNVSVTDAIGTMANQTYTVKVNGVLSLPSASLPSGIVGTVYPNQTLPAVTGGTAPYTYVATGLPPGISFNATTRVLSGTPTTGGPYTIKLTATDNAGLSTSTDYALQVNVDAPVVAAVSTCSGSPATLTVSNVIPGVIYKWYASTGSTSIATGSSFTTPALNSSTTYYAEASSGTAVSSRTAAIVTVNPPAALAVVGTANQVVSPGQTTTLQASADAGNTIQWFANATGGPVLATGATFTTPALNATTTYYVGTLTASGCASSSRVPVTVTVTSGPVNPNCNAATSQQTGIDGLCLLCSVQGAGNSTDSDLNNFTRINLVVGVGAFGYQRLIFSSPGTATDSIRLDLETPTGLADVGVLSGITVRVMNGSTVVGTYPLNSALVNLQLLNGNRFQVTVPAAAVYDRVEVRFSALVAALSNLNIYGATVVYPNPTVASSGQNICSGSATTLTATANGGTTISWFANPTGGTALASGGSFTTPVLNSTTTYYIEVSKAGCANLQRLPVTVTVTQVPAAPVLVNVPPICAGSAVTLAINNPVAGLTYNWYSAANGGTILGSGPTFTTPVLTANTTYYAEAASGSCTSATRTAVNVNISPIPDAPIVTSNSVVISSGQTATLSATTTGNNIINWYAAPTGGAILATGPTFVTAPLTATTTYYAETANEAGCVSAARVAVTVTVLGGTPNPNCNAANTQQSGINGICVLCSIQDAGNSVDANFTNYTTISLPVGVAGSGYQRLIFPAAGVGTDSIRLDLETPGGLADVVLLGGIQVRVMNGSTVVATYNLGASLLNLSLLSGNRFIATLPAVANYDRVEVRANGLASVLMNLRIYGAQVIYPNPTVSANGQTICSGSATLLSAAANGGTTLRWYSDAVGGTLLATGENFTTPTLTATTTYYIEVSKGSCANAQRIPVTVTVTTPPSAPVVAAAAPVCSGSSAILSITAPAPGISYNWYTAASGGSPMFSGPVFTTPALTANTTFYVEAANGACASASRTAVNVTVNPLPPLPQVAVSSTTVNAGQSATLTASSTDPSVTSFNWYDSASSTTPVFTGSTFVTPALSANASYFVESVSASGCTSAGRVQVNITVNGGGTPTTVPCEAATSQTNGITGLALFANVFNAGQAVDNDTQTASSLVMPVGLVGASIYQRLGFTNLSGTGDTVKVLLSSPARLLSVGLLGNVTITSYNGATSNNDGIAINNPLVNIQLLSGGAQALVSFVPAQPFDNVEVRLNSGIAGALTSINVNYGQRVLAAPQITVPNPTACAGSAATLTVQNPVAGLTYRWYDASGTFTGSTGTSFTTPVLSANAVYFVEANTASGCASAKTPVNITVTPAPVTPQLLAADVKVCLGSDVVLTVGNPQAGVIYIWKNGATIVQSGPSSTYTVTAVAGPATYTVVAQNVACSTVSAQATATVDVGTPTPPVVTPASTTVNSGERALLTATSSTAGATFTWYDRDPALPGAVVLSTPANGENGTFLTDPLTANTTIWVTSTAGACISAGSPVTITVNPAPTPESVPCEAATAQENGKSGLLAALAGVDNPDQVWDDNVNTGSSLRIPVGVGTSVYQRAIFTGPSVIGDKVRLKLVSPGTILSLGLLQSVQVTTYLDATSNGDTRTISDPLLNLQLLSANTEALIEFTPASVFDRVEVRLNSGLLGALTSINFNYAQRILTPPVVLAANVNACAGTSATLSVQNPDASLTYKWYLGTTYQTGKDGATFLTDPSLAAGSYDYFVSASRNGCESVKTKVTVTVLNAPDAPVPAAGNPTVACPNTPVTLAVNTVANVSFNWYDSAGNLLAANTPVYTTGNLTVGSYDFFVEAANANSCTSTAPRTKITVKVNPGATAADLTIAGLPASVCAGTTLNLTASAATVVNPIFTWYSDASLTTVAFTGASVNIPVTATTTYYVTVKGDNKCENLPGDAKVVAINVNPPATAADLEVDGANAALCAGSTATLVAKTTTVTNPVFTWYKDAALTDIAYSGATFTTPVLTATTTYYVTVRGDNKCENLAANAEVITLVVNPPAVASDINIVGGGSAVCAGSAITLSATTSTVTNPVFTWYSDAGLTTAVHTGATFTTPALSSTTTYYVTVKGTNSCENTPATAKAVTLIVNPPATPADINIAGNNASYCAGSSATLTATSSTVLNPVFTWYSDAALTVPVYVGANFNTPTLNVSTTYYLTVRGSNSCENLPATAKVITLVVNPPATAADIDVAGANAPFCSGNAGRLVASSSTVNDPIFTWYNDAALTDVAFVGPVFNTPALTATTTYYVTVRGSNKCENLAGNAKIITLVVNTPATTADVIISGADSPYCSGATITLSASSTTVNDPMFIWYTDAALNNPVFAGPVLTIPAANASITYYVTVSGSNRCENTPGTARVVNVVVNPLPEVPIVTSAGTNICSGDATVLTVQNAQTGVTYQWYDAATNGTLLFSGSQYTTNTLNANTDFYVMAVSASGCGNPTGRVKVTVTVSPKPVAPSVAANTVNVCSGSATVLSILNPQAGVTYKWYSAAVGGNLLGTGVDFITPVITSSTTFYAEASTASCISTTRTAVTVIPAVPPVAPASVSGATDPQCSGAGTVLTVNNPDPLVNYRWYTLQSGGTPVFEGNPFTVSSLSATTTYYVESVNKSSGCVSMTRTAVTVTVLPKLDAPVVTAQTATPGAITFQWNAVPGATAYEVSLDNGATWISPTAGPSGTSYTVSGLQPDQSVTIMVRAKGQLACQLSNATTLTDRAINPQGNTVFVPNTFTPNNDGKNDVFYVYGNTISKMKLRVYNQWGQFLYESTSIQNGWDGTYKGELQPNGVYVYYLDVVFNDGSKSMKKGTITLLR
ncbi:Ig-like domain-containing protein [Pedobacter sp. PWIIR3]